LLNPLAKFNVCAEKVVRYIVPMLPRINPKLMQAVLALGISVALVCAFLRDWKDVERLAFGIIAVGGSVLSSMRKKPDDQESPRSPADARTAPESYPAVSEEGAE
jgi:hypothetical protein